MGPLTRRRLLTFALALFGAGALAYPSLSADRVPTGADAVETGALKLVVEAASDDDTVGGDEVTETDRLFEIPVEDGEEVTLAYTHSVEKTPVEDVYVVDGTELRAERMVFHSFGAGLPTENVERTEDGYVVEGEGTYETLHVVPGSIAGHELLVGDDRYDLVAAADGGVVLFLTERDGEGRANAGSKPTATAAASSVRPATTVGGGSREV